MSCYLVVLVTVPAQSEADTIAEALISERLAACVNIIPGLTSVYRWEGKVLRESELLLVIKTTSDRYSELQARVKQLHSYTTPEIIALEFTNASEDYLAWIDESILTI
jgi:periplasmic divalent cation tolerance protein